MKWAVGVITCPREKPTLKATLRSLKQAGFDYAGVLHDDKLDGCYRNWRKLAQLLVDLDVERILLSEDDCQYTKGLRSYLDEGLPEGVVSLYTGSVNHHKQRGWHQVTDLPKKCHGALATVWTPKLLAEFLAYDRSEEFKNGTDTLIGMWCKRSKTTYWCHSPSFVRHTGDTSAIDPSWDDAQQAFRQCKAWLPEV